MIHEQVQKQLEYLKYWVDAEKKDYILQLCCILQQAVNIINF